MHRAGKKYNKILIISQYGIMGLFPNTLPYFPNFYARHYYLSDQEKKKTSSVFLLSETGAVVDPALLRVKILPRPRVGRGRGNIPLLSPR